MNQIVSQEVTATSATVNSQCPQERRMLNFIQHHTLIYFEEHHFKHGLHEGFTECLFDTWTEKEIFFIDKEDFRELVITEYFSLAKTGSLNEYKGYILEEDIFLELGELPNNPHVKKLDFEKEISRLEEEVFPSFSNNHFTTEGDMEKILNTEDAADVASSLSQVRAVPKPGVTKKKAKPLTAKKPLERKTRIKVKPVSREFPKILSFAENVEKCTCCGKHSETIVAAHLSGEFAHEFGKGMGCKVSDLFVAFVCMGCHFDFDNLEVWKDAWLSVKFMRAILRSQVLLLKARVLIVVDPSEELEEGEEE